MQANRPEQDNDYDKVTVLPKDRKQLVLDLGHIAAQGEADFMVSEGNRLAFDHICAFPKWSAPITLLEGPPKSGKSHLARIWLERAGAVAVLPETAEAIASGGGSEPLLLDDVDRAGFGEEAVFHILNQSMRKERPVLLTARTPISRWPYKTNDLKSRARLAAWFSIAVPDDIFLSQMFVKLFADRQLSVDPKVISYLVARMERSAEEVVALVELADTLSLSGGRAVTRAIAAEALESRAARYNPGANRES